MVKEEEKKSKRGLEIRIITIVFTIFILVSGKVHTIVYLFILNMDGSHHRVP